MSLANMVRAEILKRIKRCPGIYKFLWKTCGMGRTQRLNAIRWANQGYVGSIQLKQHLREKHPKTWYDDESDALYFMIYDYIRSTGAKITIKEASSSYTGTRYRDICIESRRDLYWADDDKTQCLLTAYISYCKYH